MTTGDDIMNLRGSIDASEAYVVSTTPSTEGDLGIVILEHEIRTSRFMPACLPKQDVKVMGKAFYITSWGLEIGEDNTGKH